MQEDFSESATLSKPPLWNQVSTDLKPLFTYQNRVEITQRYFGKRQKGGWASEVFWTNNPITQI